MAGFRNTIIGAMSALIRAAIKSPQFQTGVQGWSINKDGSAELNSVIIRGSFDGTDFVINNTGAFFYSGTPGLSNLIASIARAPGTDPYGNAYVAGVGTYRYHFPGGAQGVAQFAAAVLSVTDWAGHEQLKLQYTANDLPGDGAVISGLAANAGLAGGTYGAAETWHLMTLLNGWADGSAGNAKAAYRMLADSSRVMLVGTIRHTAATSAVFAQLPAAYRPASTQFFAVGCAGASPVAPFLSASPAGNLSINNAPAGAGDYVFSGDFSLDAAGI